MSSGLVIMASLSLMACSVQEGSYPIDVFRDVCLMGEPRLDSVVERAAQRGLTLVESRSQAATPGEIETPIRSFLPKLKAKRSHRWRGAAGAEVSANLFPSSDAADLLTCGVSFEASAKAAERNLPLLAKTRFRNQELGSGVSRTTERDSEDTVPVTEWKDPSGSYRWSLTYHYPPHDAPKAGRHSLGLGVTEDARAQ